jgi:tyrosyl-tRNA synthetase
MKAKKCIEELHARGLIEHFSGETLEEILRTQRHVYVGVDPTADSMHVGNLVPIILLKHLADAGHTPHLLVGGGTGMIGDPRESGERTLLDEKTLQRNMRALKKQLSGVLRRDKLTVFNNADWLKNVKLIDFLRDIGKHFTVNQLVKRDLIKRRLDAEDSISYTEFSYTLLQGYDFHYLYKRHGIDLQVGGTDQWANVLSGVELIRRLEGQEAYAMTTPMIIDKTTGKKFGKSEGNAIWLDPKKTSEFAFYQFWINTADENVAHYLRIFSFSPLKKIEKTLAVHQAEPHKRAAQKLLAQDVTDFVHGKEARQSVEKVSQIIFGGKSIPKLNAADQELLKRELPHHKLTTKEKKHGMNIVDVLTTLTLASSKSEARRLLESKAVTVNGKLANQGTTITGDTCKDGVAIIRRGKRVGVVSVA